MIIHSLCIGHGREGILGQLCDLFRRVIRKNRIGTWIARWIVYRFHRQMNHHAVIFLNSLLRYPCRMLLSGKNRKCNRLWQLTKRQNQILLLISKIIDHNGNAPRDSLEFFTLFEPEQIGLFIIQTHAKPQHIAPSVFATFNYHPTQFMRQMGQRQIANR